MPVKAPFRFARINRWIHEPAWGPLVSHDVPFADGLSGRVTLRITAKTPLLLGGRRRGASDNLEGAVWPFRLPDGRWALPPSTLQGMTRAILEVAAFGRLGAWVEDRRFGIRDLTNSETAKRHYRSRLVNTVNRVIHPKTLAGWLTRIGDKPHIVPCDLSRVHVDDLEALRASLISRATGQRMEPLERLRQGATNAEQRYAWFLAGLAGRGALDQEFLIEPKRPHHHASINRRINESYAVPLKGADPGAVGNRKPGTIVITGKVKPPRGVHPLGPRQKKREFVFHSPSRATLASDFAKLAQTALAVDDKTWDTFLYLHCKADGTPDNAGWRYWAEDYKHGHPVPVFWWPEAANPRQVSTFGMAFAPKAGFPLSTHDALRHSHPGHLKDPAEAALDLPNLIFGVAAEGDNGRGLKRRAWFGLGQSTGADSRLQNFNQPAILSSPKPKYLGLYVRQRSTDDDTIPQGGRDQQGEPMAAYSSLRLRNNEVVARDKATALDNLARPELSGVKVWPSSADRDRGVQIPDPPHVAGAQPPGPRVKTELHAVPASTVFEAPLTFHNLRPVELGALLWALSFGNPKAFETPTKGARMRHRLGMGKPFGLGEVEISIEGLETKKATTLMAAFIEHMEQEYPKPGIWTQSPQVRALLKAANPGENRAPDLTYMNVTGRDGYVDNRNRGAFLGAYVDETSELDKLPVEASQADQIQGPAAQLPATPTDPATSDVDLEPAIGARVRCRPNANPRIAGKEGVIEKLPDREFGDFHIRMGERVERIKGTLFKVIAPSED